MTKRSNQQKRKQGKNGTSKAVSQTLFRPTDVYKPKPAKTVSTAMVVNGRFRDTSSRKRGPKGLPTLPPVLTSYVDPFATDILGVRYPDAFRGLSGTFASVFEGRLKTAPAAGFFTDLNMVDVAPLAGSSLCLFTPDPSNVLINGICGTGTTGWLGGEPDQFHWPNGIKFTGDAQSLNAFGPGGGLINRDVVLPNLGPMREMYSAARLVAGGVKITGTMNYSTVSGTIHMAPVFVSLNRQTSNRFSPTGTITDPTDTEMQNGWQCTLPANFSDMANLPGYCSYPMSSLEADELVAIFKRVGEEALLFKPTSTAWGMDNNSLGALASRYGDSDNPNNYGHYCVLVFIDNVLNAAGEPAAAGTSLVEFQMKNHYECQMNPASSVLYGSMVSGSGVVSQAPPYQPLLLAAVDNLSADIPAIRCLDDAGISETGFMTELSRAWKGAVGVATSVATAVEIGAALLGAFTI